VIGAAKLHAFETATGAARFVLDFGMYGGTADNGVTPAVLTDNHYSVGGVVFFSDGAAQNPQVFSADPITGGADPITGALGGCPAFSNGTSPRFATIAIGHGILYFQTRERLYIRNATHCGSRIYGVRNFPSAASYPVAGSPGFTAPAIANGVVYSGTNAFAPIVTSATPPLWSAGASASSPSVIADGRLYALADTKLIAYGLPPRPSAATSSASEQAVLRPQPGSAAVQGSVTAGPAAPTSDDSARTYATRPQRRQVAERARLSSPGGVSHAPRLCPPERAAASALWQRSSSATVMLATLPDGPSLDARPRRSSA
jgi:hypothetical protein